MMGIRAAGADRIAASKAIALLRLSRRRFDLFAITFIFLAQPRVEELIQIATAQAAAMPNWLS
jgi:hypothetical protein